MEIPFARLGHGLVLNRLTSARLWLWETIAGRSPGPGRAPPVVGLAFVRLGNAAAANGDVNRALECYSRASALIPSDTSLRKKLEELGGRKTTGQPPAGAGSSQR